MSQKVYSYKLLQQITEQKTRLAVAFTLEAVLASLADRFKFDEGKLELLMKDVTTATRNKDVVTRQDLKDIIEKYTGVEV